MTYLVNLEASAAIWVTGQPRREHQEVIEWLNEFSPKDISFYLVKVEAARIGRSPYAPLFTVVAAPDRQTKDVGKSKKDWAKRHFDRLKFWEGLLEKSKARTGLFSNISPGRQSWIATGAGKSGLKFSYVVNMDCGSIELFIDLGKGKDTKNKAIFDALYAQKDSIEKEFRGPLKWQRLDKKRACRIISKWTREGGLASPGKWPNLQEWMIDAMIRFERAIRPRLANLDV